MTSADKELEEQLLEAGNKLLDPPSSVDELLPLLDRVESCLSRVEQSPSKSMQKSLSPSLKALVADKLLSHSDVDVKVAVASCISEITRITAPEAPYDDEQMKEVFQLIVSSFENLLEKSSPSYKKRASIVETVAKVRSCVVMLDLECDALIVEMFQHFFKAVREQHPEGVLQSIETIMALVIEESEEISLDLLAPILASVKKDEEALTAKKMGERVLESCATKLRPYIVQAVKTLGISLDDYSKVLSTICQGTPVSVEQNDGCTGEHVEDGSKSAKEPLEESTQVVKEDSREAPPQEVNTVEDKSPKSVMSNGTAQTGEDNSLADAKSAKKQDGADPSTDQLKGINDSGNEECNTFDADKVDKTGKVDESEQKSEQASEQKGRTSNSGKAEPSEGHTVSIEKEDEKLPDSNIPQSKDQNSPKNDHSAEAAGRSENDIETDVHFSSPKAVEDEPEVVASPTTESLPDENRSKKSGRIKKKGSSVKGGAEPTEEDSKKVSEKIIGTEVVASPLSESIPDENRSKKSGRTKRKGSSVKGGAETTEEDSKKVSEETSDIEAVASPPTECLPVENRSKKSGRTKKKSSAVKGGAEPIEEDSKKVSEETSDTDIVASPASESLPDENLLKKSGRTKKGSSVKGEPEPIEEDSKKVPEESSDTEAVASPPSESLPDENRLKKSGRTKKGSSFKGGAEPTKEDSKKVSEETSDTEAKHATCSAKKTPGGRFDRKKTTVVYSAKKGSQAASDSDVKKFTAKKVDESDKSGGGYSARQSEDRNKRKRGKNTSDAIVSKSGKDVDKETLSLTKSGTRSAKDEEQPEETAKSNLKRKRTPGKEIASDTKEHGEKLVGLRVEVYWPKDRVYYKGVIDSFDPVKKKHKVVYDDNDEEVLNLSREKWNRLEDEPSSDTDKEEDSDQPSPDASPDMPPRKKGQANADDAIQQAKEDSSSRSGGAKSGKSKGALAKSVVKSKVDSKSKISKTVGKSDEEVAKKPKDNSPKSGGSKSVKIATKTAVKAKITDSTNKKSKSKDEDVSTSKPSAKAKQETPKTGKSKQETTSTVSASKGKTQKSGVKSSINGSGKMKSGSLKAKEPEKENSDESMDEVEEPRVKSASSVKMLVSEGRPGKKRRRG